MASESATESIADRVAQSLAAFEAIDKVETQAEPTDSQSVCVQAMRDQLSKFKLWAGNIGAHRTGRRSLDYRLRDASHLHTQVMRLLGDLITSLGEVHSILSGETLPWDQDPWEADELDEELEDLLMNEDFEFDSELSQLAKEVTDAVGNLLRLSISLRNPAPHDRFMSTEYANVHYFEANDKAHVEAKFPRASQALVIRLGQALSQRRQYFKYRESHHEKLARGLFDSGRSEAGAQSTIASSIPAAMRVPGAVPVSEELDEDERSDAGFSQTSFATTAPESGRLSIPPIPRRAYDGPFECPFCFMLISVSSTHQWKKHVLRDLRPYICLAEDCATASREYGRRHEWMNHMFQKHWKSWECPYQCGFDSTTETNLRRHIARLHGSKTEMELDAMIARCARTRSISSSSPVECPFCQDTLESVQQYQRHVGRHQVDLALFALPKIEDDDEELDEENEEQETVSTRSGSYIEEISDGVFLRIIDAVIDTVEPRPSQPNLSEAPHITESASEHYVERLGTLSEAEGQTNDNENDIVREKGSNKASAEQLGPRSPAIIEEVDRNAPPKKCTHPGCNKGFIRACDLERHEKTHTRPFKCPQTTCKYHEFGWPTEKELNRHVNDKHAVVPEMFECQFKPCPYKSKRELNCKQHMEKAHGWTYLRSKIPKSKGSKPGDFVEPTPMLNNQPTPPSHDQTDPVMASNSSHKMEHTERGDYVDIGASLPIVEPEPAIADDGEYPPVYELDQAQMELREVELIATIEKDESRHERTVREERELREAKKELDLIRAKREQEELNRRLDELTTALYRLKNKEDAEREAKEAVRKQKKEAEAERSRMRGERRQERLLQFGLSPKTKDSQK